MINKCKKLTSEDTVLKNLKYDIQNGWCDARNYNSDEEHLKKFRYEITEKNGILFENNKIIVPKLLQREMLEKIHYGHLGIEKCKNRARESLYWKNIDKDIENFVKHCFVCNKYKRANTKQPMIPHEIPNCPWEKLGVDIFELDNKYYILAVDYFS